MSTHHEELNFQESTCSLVAANFCVPDRDQTINGTNSYASNDTSITHPGDVVSRSSYNGAQKSPQRTRINGFNEPTSINKCTGNKGTNKCSAVGDWQNEVSNGKSIDITKRI